MSTTICTGSEKCRVVNLVECPACHNEMEIAYSVYVYSHTIGDRVCVCRRHLGKDFTAAEEIEIQKSADTAQLNKRGHILKDGVLVKAPKAMSDLVGKKF